MLYVSEYFLYFFFFKPELRCSPIHTQKQSGFLLEVHFYSAVEMIILKLGWLVRNVAVWATLSKAWYL